MFNKTGQSGFSLMEVLFAIVVLSLGLVFVAVLFPVGLSYSRVVTEATLGDIEMHNAAVMKELQISAGNIGSGRYYLDTTTFGLGLSGSVHFLCQPNVRIESSTYDIVMDDPTGYYFTLIPPYPADGYHWYNPNSQDNIPGYLDVDKNNSMQLAPRNIATIVSSAVSFRDKAVEKYLNEHTGDDYPDNFHNPDATLPYAAQIDEAMFEVSMGRKDCCSYLYQCLDSNKKTFRFLIFYLKIDQRNRRYAMQANWDAGNIAETVAALDADQDRAFPVPWRLYLGTTLAITTVVSQTYRLPLDMLEIPPELVEFICPGGFIVDADADPTVPDAYPQSGLVYEITAVEKITVNVPGKMTADNYMVRLRSKLQDNMDYFWVFPPSVNEFPRQHQATHPRRFRDVQPVIKMVEKVIDF